MQSQPMSLQLRYLQTVTEIAAENNSTTLFPIPIDLLKPFLQRADDSVASVTPAGASLPPAAAPGMFAAKNLADGLPQVQFETVKKPIDE